MSALAKSSVISEEQIQSFLGDKVAGFKVPAHIWICEEKLPRIASGKIFKKQIRADFIARLDL
jgi:acyl-CoA synthetase (AMP-forming)/AMP-acid ligase II